MANLLLGQRSLGQVGKNWTYNFLKRHEDLKTRYTRRYNYERAQCEDSKAIRDWFELVRKIIEQYGITSEDIYNFDETGFAIGLIATAKVVIEANSKGRPVLLQPGNREWVTAIEAINSTGWVLPPMLIFAGKTHRTTWFEDTQLPRDWTIAVSDNGWTTDQLGLQWLKSVFEPYTVARTKGSYRLLILDGHSSHVNPAFDQFCSQHKIVPLCMPAHSSHLLQPLDVGCFAVLKRSYGQ